MLRCQLRAAFHDGIVHGDLPEINRVLRQGRDGLGLAHEPLRDADGIEALLEPVRPDRFPDERQAQIDLLVRAADVVTGWRHLLPLPDRDPVDDESGIDTRRRQSAAAGLRWLPRA